ncbi:Uncharacterized protein Fot_03627 [Forsythia ovata]|uniref:Uncharacterized protein n=1 Tax=Forsythia ovata TaxID=205694 RepID=A0ABD1XDD1_9LAMI
MSPHPPLSLSAAMDPNRSEQSSDRKAETKVNSLTKCDKYAIDLHVENLNGTNGVISASVFTNFKDGSSNSTDSSAILNNDNKAQLLLFLHLLAGFHTRAHINSWTYRMDPLHLWFAASSFQTQKQISFEIPTKLINHSS